MTPSEIKNGLPDFDRILFGDLGPLQPDNKPQDWFAHLSSKMENEPLLLKTIWEVYYIKAINPMTQFYKSLIDNQHNRYYNHLCSEMLQASNREEKIFMLADALRNVIGVKLKETAREIHSCKADPEVLKGDIKWKQEQGYEWENVYILHYLKLKLTALYLNIQDLYAEFLYGEKLTAADLELAFFKGIPVSPGSIRQTDDTKQPMEPVSKTDGLKNFAEVLPEKTALSTKDVFNPLVKQIQFQEIVNRLKEYGILDPQDYFIDNRKKSHKRMLSAVYRMMIDCGYFRKTNPITNKTIKDNDIRSYLDNLFCANLKETFRKLNHAHLEDAKIKLPWLDKMR